MPPTNLLLLFSDEHDPRYSGCYGSELAQTPNIDALAARGTRFARAWTPSPICVPARASLATGRHVHEIGYWDNAIAYDGRVRSWHQRLSDAGMRTESIGKLHFRSGADPTGFRAQHEAMHIQDGVGLIWGSVRDPLPERAPHRSPLFDELGAGESSYNRYDARITDLAEAWLAERAARSDGKPWVLFVGLVAPHMPFMVPQPFLDRYPAERVPLPQLLPRDGYRRHPWVERMAQHWDHDGTLGNDARRILAKRAYLGLISRLDEMIGRLLATLDRTGLAQTTRVVYTSDHGDNQGKRGMWNKSLPYRESTAVPMIVAGPGVPRGRVCNTNASLVDLYPTVLDCTGLVPDGDEQSLPGRSLVQMANAPDDLDRVGFSQYHAVGAPTAFYMLTQGRFKYHHYVGYAPELFDIEADPEETRDLAGDPAHRATLAGFERTLRAMLDPEATDRRAKDDQNAAVARLGGAQAVMNLGNRGSTPTPDKFNVHRLP